MAKTDHTLSADKFLENDYNADEIIASVALQGLQIRGTNTGSLASQVEVLLQRMQRLDTQLAQLSSTQGKLSGTSKTDGIESVNYKMAAATARLATLQTSLSVLEHRASSITQLCSRVGVRMKHIEDQKRKALSAASLLHNLNEFIQVEDPEGLPFLFHDDRRITEAATIAGKLHSILKRVMEGGIDSVDTATATNKDITTATPLASSSNAALLPQTSLPPSPPAPLVTSGSIASAAYQLHLYLDVLDTRIVALFDTAMASQDFTAMATCCRAMAAARGSDALLVSRYISTRPVFANPDEVERLAGNTPSGLGIPQDGTSTITHDNNINSGLLGGSSTTRITSEVFRSLSTFLREESMVMEQVFLDPGTAIATLVHRVFAQTVQGLLSEALLAPPSHAPPEVLRSYLRVLADAHRKTLGLAQEGRALAGAAVGDPHELTATACGPALDQYLAIELKYLAELGGLRLNNNSSSSSSSTSVNQEVVLDLLSLNEEAMKRCVSISDSTQLAVNVRVLFHSVAAAGPSLPGGLLGQIASHLFKGMSATATKCLKHLVGPLRHSTPSEAGYSARAAVLRTTAEKEVGEPVNSLLKCLAEVAACVVLLRKYYVRVVQPQLASAPTEEEYCATGIAELIAAVNDRGSVILRQLVAQCVRKVDQTLVAEQRKSDFRPSPSDPDPPLDESTLACCSAVAILREVGNQVSQHLHGPNQTSFLTELAAQTVTTLRSHMLRFIFSTMGALRWQQDVSEYSSCLVGDVGAPNARRLLEDLHALSNLLVVSPESLPHVLPELTDTKLRLGPSDVSPQQYLERREDYKTVVAGIIGKV